MGYREVIMSQNPISFWPLDDDSNLGVIGEATGKGISGTYEGSVFDKAIPLVANGVYGTRLLDSTAKLNFPLPGAIGSGDIWNESHIWSTGRETQNFSVELYFKLDESAQYLSNEVVLFGNIVSLQSSQNSLIQTYTDLIDDYNTYSEVLAAFATYDQILNATIPAPYGIYLYKNKIYFRPDPLVNYYVAYQVPDWKRRYHVIANYSEGNITMIVNGEHVVSKSVNSVVEDFDFSISSGLRYCKGSDNYPVTLDAVAIYPYNIDLVRAFDHCSLSRQTVLRDKFYSSNSQIFYMPNNMECITAYRMVNNWALFDFDNVFVDSKNRATLRYISHATLSGGTGTFGSVSGRDSITLGAGAYIDISNVIRLSEGGTALSMTFNHSSSTPEKGLMTLYNFQSSQNFSAYVNASNKIVINLNGSITTTNVSPLAGWNELLIENIPGKFDVYLNEVKIFTSVDYIQTITDAYIGKVNDLYATCPVAWIAIKTGIMNNQLVNHRLYNETADYILKTTNNLKWSQTGTMTGFLYVPAADYSGSLAFYTTSHPNVSITYNNGLQWPKMGTLPGLTESTTGQVNEYNILVTMTTDDSEEDLPILSNIGLYVYSQGMKRVTSDNSNENAEIVNIDSLIIHDDNVDLLDRFDQAGIRLAGNSYIKIPSQANNYDAGGFNGTKSISITFKINESLTGTKYIFDSGSKSLYWDGTSWQHPGFSAMYVNGQLAFDDAAMVDDWVHVVLTSTSKINAGTNIYIGSNASGANQTDMNLGIFSMAAYSVDQADAENEYEMLVGTPHEDLALDNITFQMFDYGLTPYKVAWQKA